MFLIFSWKSDDVGGVPVCLWRFCSYFLIAQSRWLLFTPIENPIFPCFEKIFFLDLNFFLRCWFSRPGFLTRTYVYHVNRAATTCAVFFPPNLRLCRCALSAAGLLRDGFSLPLSLAVLLLVHIPQPKVHLLQFNLISSRALFEFLEERRALRDWRLVRGFAKVLVFDSDANAAIMSLWLVARVLLVACRFMARTEDSQLLDTFSTLLISRFEEQSRAKLLDEVHFLRGWEQQWERKRKQNCFVEFDMFWEDLHT